MKKITLFIAFLLFSIAGKAQIPNGSVAPDFTVTDINGVSHTLSTYLAAGKTVVIDISATWCQPCWNYHNTKALEDLYYSYGPGGSNEVVVLFVEGDNNTTLADLNGTGTNTRGNWVAGTPYPIIDGSNIASLYQIDAFPTVFRVMPNGLVYEAGASSASTLRAQINNFAPLVGAQNNVGALENSGAYCTPTGAPVGRFRNYGENSISNATLHLKENGTVVATKAFTGTTPRFTTRTVNFDPITVNPDAEYTVEVVDVNGASVFNPSIAEAEMDLTVARQATESIVLKVYTDNYPTEISWNVKNSGGTIVASGGPYVGSANGGGVDANTTKIHNINLPANECYTITLLDSFGDGWGYGSTPHGIEVFDSSNTSIYSVLSPIFSTSLVKSNALTTSLLSTGSFEVSQLSIFPNPSNGIVYVNSENPVAVDVFDVTGKVVFSASQVSKERSMNLSTLQKGIYFARITNGNSISTEKIILN